MNREALQRCLSPEEVTAYASGELSPDELERVDEHIADCSICRQVVSNAAELGLVESAETVLVSSGSAAPREALAPGAVVGRYVVDGAIGAGGMGVVYAARDPELRRKVALKVLRAGLFDGDGASRELLRREAMAMARLTHPNVVGIYDLFEDAGTLFVAMEFIEGTTLREWLQGGPRPWRETLAMFTLAGRGLAAAHAEGVVHRDFKPENVLVGASGRVCVSDFGLSRIGEGRDAGSTGRHVATTPGLSLPRAGTPRYMGPEQRLGELATARTDQYSFCVALHEGLYGGHPVEASSGGSGDKSAPSVRLAPRRLGRVPAYVRACLKRGLREVPGERFASMDELLAALARDPSAKRRRVALGLTVAAALGVGAGLWHHARVVRREICAHRERELDGVWDAARRRRAEDALGAVGPYGKNAWVHLGPLLDAYAASWAASRTRVCAASLEGRDPAAVADDPRMRCLDDRLDETRVLADAVGSVTTARAAAASLVAIQSLRPVALCDGATDANAAHRRKDPKDDGAREAIRADLAQAAVNVYLGRDKEAGDAAIRARAAAEAIGDPELTVRSVLQAGEAHASSGSEQADAELKEALSLADANGDDHHRAEALARLVFVDGYYRSNWKLSRLWRDEALAVLHRIGGNDLLEAEVRNHYGVVLTQQLKFDEARAELEESVRLYQRIGDRVSLPAALDNLGLAYAGQRDHDAAIQSYRRALAVIDDAFGPTHPRNARVLNNWASTEISWRNFDDAAERAKRAIAINEGLGIDDGLTAEEPIETAGEALLEAGHYAEALPYLERSHAIEEKAAASAQWQSETLTDIGRARLGLHDPAGALSILDRVVGAKVGEARFLAQARFAVALALTELHSDPGRARSEASAALASLDAMARRSPLDEALRDEVRGWLASR